MSDNGSETADKIDVEEVQAVEAPKGGKMSVEDALQVSLTDDGIRFMTMC